VVQKTKKKKPKGKKKSKQVIRTKKGWRKGVQSQEKLKGGNGQSRQGTQKGDSAKF